MSQIKPQYLNLKVVVVVQNIIQYYLYCIFMGCKTATTHDRTPVMQHQLRISFFSLSFYRYRIPMGSNKICYCGLYILLELFQRINFHGYVQTFNDIKVPQVNCSFKE